MMFVQTMSLAISITNLGDTSLLKCVGRITLGEGSVVLRDTVRDALVGGAKNIVLDLSDVSYMDSSGIGELVSAFTTTRNSGGNLVLTSLTKRVSDLLQITKLYTVFETFETVDAAVEFLKPGSVSKERDESEIQES
jgi:anti-sigma B factor antagonist